MFAARDVMGVVSGCDEGYKTGGEVPVCVCDGWVATHVCRRGEQVHKVTAPRGSDRRLD